MGVSRHFHRREYHTSDKMPPTHKRLEYKLYYDPAFDFDQSHVLSAHKKNPVHGSARETRMVIEQVKMSMNRTYQKDPIMVYVQTHTLHGVRHWKVHPGKCRVTAARELGWNTVRALIVDKGGHYNGPGREITPVEAYALFQQGTTFVCRPDYFDTGTSKPFHYQGQLKEISTGHNTS